SAAFSCSLASASSTPRALSATDSGSKSSPRAIVSTRMMFLTVSRVAAHAIWRPSAMASAVRPTPPPPRLRGYRLSAGSRADAPGGARMHRLDVTGRTSVITGAAHGMGAEVARRLADRGARVALVARDPAGLAAVAAALPGTGHTTHVVDLRDDAAVDALAADIAGAHPHLQTLITCAGSSMLGSIDQLTMEEMRWLVDVNL